MKTKKQHNTKVNKTEKRKIYINVIEDEKKKDLPIPWPEFIKCDTNSNNDIKKRLIEEINSIIKNENLGSYFLLYLYDSYYPITSYASDRIYTALTKINKGEKNVFLILLSTGGSIEPAYHISRLCSEYSKDKFIVVIPRFAKSAATLISLGAKEIHMGPLSELGPIDPQINGRPVLGLSYSLEQIAKICVLYPKSSEIFSEYLKKSLYVPDIGYWERLGESAVQYAERLLYKTIQIREKANSIAMKFVYDYKDHSFVINIDEAKEILGKDIIKVNTQEYNMSENIHQLFDTVDSLLGIYRNKKLRIIGDIESGIRITTRSN